MSEGRTNAVPGHGNPEAKIMFIGEGPGYHEDIQGLPFVGPAGQLLDDLLGEIGLNRKDVFITNVVKCRPPQNRDPQPDEIGECSKYLDRQIELIDPDVIVTLGRYSLARYLPGEKISRVHGSARTIDGRTVIAMYHPAAALHQPSLRQTISEDFQKILTAAQSPAAPAVDDNRDDAVGQLPLF